MTENDEKGENDNKPEDNKSEVKNNGNLQESQLEKKDERRIDDWMIRPCDMYQEEYSDCTSIKARFHQYFIFGESIDCSQWKKDFKSCEKWFETKDEAAYQELIASETKRRLARFKAHYANNIWKRREKPPENWNSPLPEWMQTKFTNSYLDHMSRSSETDKINHPVQKTCTIL